MCLIRIWSYLCSAQVGFAAQPLHISVLFPVSSKAGSSERSGMLNTGLGLSPSRRELSVPVLDAVSVPVPVEVSVAPR